MPIWRNVKVLRTIKQRSKCQNITLDRQTILIIISSANPLRATTHGRAVICQTFYTYQHRFYQLRLSTTIFNHKNRISVANFQVSSPGSFTEYLTLRLLSSH